MNATPNAELIDRAQSLARGAMQQLAKEADAAAQFPKATFALLHEAGLLKLAIPAAAGGLQVDWLTYLTVLRILAGACGSSANALNMHSTVCRFLTHLATPAQQQEVFADIVETGALISSITTEPQTSLRGAFDIATHCRFHNESVAISGRKSFCTMATVARWHHVTCRDPTAEGIDSVHTFIVPSANSAIEVHDDWHTLGMRGTASNSVSFHNVVLPRAAEVATGGALWRSGLTHYFTPGYAAIYHGIARAAFAWAIEQMKLTKVSGDDTSMAEWPSTQRIVGEMSAQLAGVDALLEHTARNAEQQSALQCAHGFNQTKLLATTTAREVVQRSFDLVGGRALSQHSPMERYLRDVQAGNLMQPSAETCREMVGKRELGLRAIKNPHW